MDGSKLTVTDVPGQMLSCGTHCLPEQHVCITEPLAFNSVLVLTGQSRNTADMSSRDSDDELDPGPAGRLSVCIMLEMVPWELQLEMLWLGLVCSDESAHDAAESVRAQLWKLLFQTLLSEINNCHFLVLHTHQSKASSDNPLNGQSR